MYVIDDPGAYTRPEPHSTDAAAGYIVKRIVSGPMVEYEIYPAHRRPPPGVRAKKAKPTSKKLKRQNEKNARKLFTRLLNANFGKKDLYFTGTVEGPLPSIDQLKKIADNFLSRWQYARKKEGLSPGKYLCVLEEGTEKMRRVHVHFILEGGLSRDDVEARWKHGRTNCRFLQPDEAGLEGLARYLMKNPKGRKRWYASKKLKRPKITLSRMTRRQAEKIARNEHEARAYFSKRDKQSAFVGMQTSYSDLVPGAYMHIITRRLE